MNVCISSSLSLSDKDIPLLAVPVFDTEDGAIPALPSDLPESTFGSYLPQDLKGKLGEYVVAYWGKENGVQRILFIGIGKTSELTLEVIRQWSGHVVRVAESIGLIKASVYLSKMENISIDHAGQAVVEGAVMASWSFTEMKSSYSDLPPKVSEFTVVADSLDLEDIEDGVEVGEIIGRASNLARTLQSRPGNVATPTHLADQALIMAKERDLDVTVMGPIELQKERMHALLSVAQGSDQEPRLIVIRHNKGIKGDPPLVLIGKGLTFDAGGISIKPAKGMEDMIFDMSGGAAVIAAMQAVSELEIPLNVVGIIPSSENLLNGSALKPGDIIESREGKTIEVVNTDAEGRLILADALSYAKSLNPAAIVDCATLTGSVVIALGHHAAAVLGTDSDLVEELREAGDLTGERCWPLPLWDEYRRQIDSEVADIVNVGGRPGGSITAACFLREFVGDYSWAHLDISGTAYGEGKLSYHRKGATGFPTKLLIQWVRGRCA